MLPIYPQQIMNESYKVASGFIQSEFARSAFKCYDTDMVLSSQDIYQLLQDRDYNYREVMIR